MIYPSHLLPQTNYKEIEMCEELSKCTILRLVSSKDIFMEGTESIDPSKLQIQSGHLRDLSTNLLSIYKIEDIIIQVTNKEYFDSWEIGSAVISPVHEQDFLLNKDKGYFFFNIKDILELEMPISLSDENFSATLKLVHTPTKCNFWHFSIRAFKGDTEISTLNPPKRVWKTIKDFLVKKAFWKEDLSFHILPEHHYIT